jgi:hypothetical protein
MPPPPVDGEDDAPAAPAPAEAARGSGTESSRGSHAIEPAHVTQTTHQLVILALPTRADLSTQRDPSRHALNWVQIPRGWRLVAPVRLTSRRPPPRAAGWGHESPAWSIHARLRAHGSGSFRAALAASRSVAWKRRSFGPFSDHPKLLFFTLGAHVTLGSAAHLTLGAARYSGGCAGCAQSCPLEPTAIGPDASFHSSHRLHASIAVDRRPQCLFLGRGRPRWCCGHGARCGRGSPRWSERLRLERRWSRS